MNVYLNLAFYFALTIIFNFSENQVMHVLCWKLAEKDIFVSMVLCWTSVVLYCLNYESK